jgi:hypothetical protein
MADRKKIVSITPMKFDDLVKAGGAFFTKNGERIEDLSTLRRSLRADYYIYFEDGAGIPMRTQPAASAEENRPPDMHDPIDMIRRLSELKSQGWVTEEEYQKKKSELLEQIGK